MKKYLVIAVCAIMALSASAQRARSSSSSFFSTERSDAPITFGITAGVNFANMSLEEDGVSASPSSRTAFNVGLTVDIPLVESIYLKSGLLYSSKGYKYEHGKSTQTLSPAYLEIPILASYRFDINDATQFQFNLGPYIAYGIGGKWKREYEGNSKEGDFFDDDDTKKFDSGLQIGAGIVFSNHYYLGAAYQWGLTNIYDNDNMTVHNKNFMINLGYIF